MATVHKALPNGNAPSNAQVGDFVHTAGGTFQIVAPGTYGSSYNPDSGFWSVKAGADPLVGMQNQADINTAKSQEFAREQMSFQEVSNAKAMEFSEKEVQKNRDFQERLSNTAHQREVADLIAAGLNPILSALNGNGASTPSGASASGVTSSGASGTVDTSALGVMGAIINTMLNNQTSLEIANLQADTAIKTGSMSAGAVLGSAATSAGAQLQISRETNAMNEYLKTNFPSNAWSLVGSLASAVVGGSGSAKQRNNIGELGKKVFNAFKNMKI